MLKKVTDTILYVGANDHEVDLFEGQYVVPNGMAYNSYVILDEQIAVMDTIDASKTAEWQTVCPTTWLSSIWSPTTLLPSKHL